MPSDNTGQVLTSSSWRVGATAGSSVCSMLRPRCVVWQCFISAKVVPPSGSEAPEPVRDLVLLQVSEDSLLGCILPHRVPTVSFGTEHMSGSGFPCLCFLHGGWSLSFSLGQRSHSLTVQIALSYCPPQSLSLSFSHSHMLSPPWVVVSSSPSLFFFPSAVRASGCEGPQHQAAIDAPPQPPRRYSKRTSQKPS